MWTSERLGSQMGALGAYSTLMGFRHSPYVCTQTFEWGEDAIRGDRKDCNSPLRWDLVRMNLPGNKDYDPTMPWVYKLDELNG